MSLRSDHDRLRAVGWEIELRTVKPGRRGFSRNSYFVYTSPDGDVVFELSQALDRAQERITPRSPSCPPQT